MGQDAEEAEEADEEDEEEDEDEVDYFQDVGSESDEEEVCCISI